RKSSGDDAAAVEADRGTERSLDGCEERRPAAEAETDDADRRVGEALRVQVFASGVDVRQQAFVAEAFEQRQDLLEVVVRRGAAAGAMEDVESDRAMTRARESI